MTITPYNKTIQLIRQTIAGLTALCLISVSLYPGVAYAGDPDRFTLPGPGQMVRTTSAFAPAMIRGVSIHADNPLRFDFIIDRGDKPLSGQLQQSEYQKLVKYFLTSLTVPEKDLWVNLSPNEKDRIIPEKFGLTEMGRDLLGQDYLLKQLTASLMYPEEELGEQFWQRVRQQTFERYGHTDIPLNAFRKVWIVPERAVVFEDNNTAYVADSFLKVMLEEDYAELPHSSITDDSDEQFSMSDVVREIIVPELEHEVNFGEHFAQLRQIYSALILATWYKQTLRESLLGQVYVNKNRVRGVDVQDSSAKEKIYAQYLKAFEIGVYNYIKEEYDPESQSVIPRQYVSGGAGLQLSGVLSRYQRLTSLPRRAYSNMRALARKALGSTGLDRIVVDLREVPASEQLIVDAAMLTDPAAFVFADESEQILDLTRQLRHLPSLNDLAGIVETNQKYYEQTIAWLVHQFMLGAFDRPLMADLAESIRSLRVSKARVFDRILKGRVQLDGIDMVKYFLKGDLETMVDDVQRSLAARRTILATEIESAQQLAASVQSITINETSPLVLWHTVRAMGEIANNPAARPELRRYVLGQIIGFYLTFNRIGFAAPIRTQAVQILRQTGIVQISRFLLPRLDPFSRTSTTDTSNFEKNSTIRARIVDTLFEMIDAPNLDDEIRQSILLRMLAVSHYDPDRNIRRQAKRELRRRNISEASLQTVVSKEADSAVLSEQPDLLSAEWRYGRIAEDLLILLEANGWDGYGIDFETAYNEGASVWSSVSWGKEGLWIHVHLHHPDKLRANQPFLNNGLMFRIESYNDDRIKLTDPWIEANPDGVQAFQHGFVSLQSIVDRESSLGQDVIERMITLAEESANRERDDILAGIRRGKKIQMLIADAVEPDQAVGVRDMLAYVEFGRAIRSEAQQAYGFKFAPMNFSSDGLTVLEDGSIQTDAAVLSSPGGITIIQDAITRLDGTTLRERLYALLEERAIDLEEFPPQIGKTESNFKQMMAGGGFRITPEVLVRSAQILDVNVVELYTGLPLESALQQIDTPGGRLMLLRMTRGLTRVDVKNKVEARTARKFNANQLTKWETSETIEDDTDLDVVADVIGTDVSTIMDGVASVSTDDQAMSSMEKTDAVGGIDLNPVNMNLQIKRDSQGVPLPLNVQPIDSMQIDGFSPVIIQILPIHQLPLLSDLLDDTEQPVIGSLQIDPNKG